MSRPTTPLEFVRYSFGKMSDANVLKHCAGVIDAAGSPLATDSAAIALSRQLAAHTILITLDCEHYTLNSNEMTEIGVVLLKRQEVIDFTTNNDEGDHGQNILEKAKYYFLRPQEKAHLLTSNPKSEGPVGNRFGETRFVTFAEARNQLQGLMRQPIQNVPALKGHNHPVVILGHAIGHDMEHLNGKDLGLDVNALGTIVKVIDTQQIAKQTKHCPKHKEVIGLAQLVHELHFAHTDSHTAANDAARTFISGVLMILPEHVKQNSSQTVQQVASNLENFSRTSQAALGGYPQYCCKCGETDHMFVPKTPNKNYETPCKSTNKLKCAECEVRGLSNDSSIYPHVTLHCPIKRDEIIAERLDWFSSQKSKPKWQYDSTYAQQTYAPNAPVVAPPTKAEEAALKKHYSTNSSPWVAGSHGTPGTVYLWPSRSFTNSPLAGLGAPSKQAADAPRDATGMPILPQGTPLTMRQSNAAQPAWTQAPAPAINHQIPPPGMMGTRGGFNTGSGRVYPPPGPMYPPRGFNNGPRGGYGGRGGGFQPPPPVPMDPSDGFNTGPPRGNLNEGGRGGSRGGHSGRGGGFQPPTGSSHPDWGGWRGGGPCGGHGGRGGGFQPPSGPSQPDRRGWRGRRGDGSRGRGPRGGGRYGRGGN